MNRASLFTRSIVAVALLIGFYVLALGIAAGLLWTVYAQVLLGQVFIKLALVCVVLGMSLPTVVVYVTLAVLVAPALAQLGIAPLAAHLFLFYFGMLSLITPPNCLATFTAAAIAGANFWKTGWTGMRLGIVAYVVPFVFVYHPALVFQGTASEIAAALATAAAGVVLLAVGCAGYLFRPLGVARRALVIVAGLLLIPAPTSPLWLAANVAGAAGGGLVIVLERMATRLAVGAAPARAARKPVP